MAPFSAAKSVVILTLCVFAYFSNAVFFEPVSVKRLTSEELSFFREYFRFSSVQSGQAGVLYLDGIIYDSAIFASRGLGNLRRLEGAFGFSFFDCHGGGCVRKGSPLVDEIGPGERVLVDLSDWLLEPEGIDSCIANFSIVPTRIPSTRFLVLEPSAMIAGSLVFDLFDCLARQS